MSQEWGMEVQDILPELDQLDSFLRNSLPGKSVHTMDLIKDVLQGNWVLEPMLIWRYIRSYVCDYISDWKKLFLSLLVLFILSAVVTSFLSAFQNTQAAKATEFFFLLCQLTILITAIRQVMDIVTGAIEQMTDFLKLAIPAYMICIAAAGSGLSATIFYKLLLSFLCMIEGIVIAGIMPAAEAYMLLGAMESLMGEERFKGVLDLIKKGILWTLKGLIVVVSGSGILQTIITPVIDKTNMTFAQKTAGAIPGIGDIAESITSVTVASASAVKNSFGVVILMIMVLIILMPALKAFMILGTIRLGTALGSIGGGRRMVKCAEYMSDAGFLMLRMLVTVSALFFVAIAAITQATSL